MLTVHNSEAVFVLALYSTTVISVRQRVHILNSVLVFVNETYSQVDMSRDASVLFAMASLPGVTPQCRYSYDSLMNLSHKYCITEQQEYH